MGWTIVIYFTLLSFSLLIASILRAKLRFLKRFHVPNAITAGFVGLGLMYLLGWLMPDFMPDRKLLGNIVYHLLAITFISISLKKRVKYIDRNSLTTAFNLSLGYAIEGFIGYSLTLVFLFTFMPEIFPTFGMLLEIGFGQSSGQAYALGRQWESLGFANGGTVGLTFGAIGFLWACFVGIPLLNWGIKRGYVKDLDKNILSHSGFLKVNEKKLASGYSTTHPDVISSGSFHIAFVGFIYLIDYLFINGIIYLFGLSGSNFMHQFGNILWAYHAFFATLFALLAGKILDQLNLHHILDDGILTNISASSVDFLVTAAIMAIELVVVAEFIVPITIISVTGGVAVTLFVLFMAKYTYSDHFFERAISIFGLLTGTVSTGLALLRVIDPDYKTPAASDLVVGSGISLFIGFPLLFVINIPALKQTVKAYFLTDIAIFGYVVIVVIAMLLLGMFKKSKEEI